MGKAFFSGANNPVNDASFKAAGIETGRMVMDNRNTLKGITADANGNLVMPAAAFKWPHPSARVAGVDPALVDASMRMKFGEGIGVSRNMPAPSLDQMRQVGQLPLWMRMSNWGR